MTLSMKLLILALLLVGDIVASALVALRLIRHGRAPVAVVICGAIAASYCMVVVIVLFLVPGAEP